MTKAAEPAPAQRRQTSPRSTRLLRSVTMTRRAMALAVVVAVLVVAFAESLRLYLHQQSELAAAESQIQAHSAAIATLKDEVQRWQDPSYVEAQARTRLGWVMPGETGYVVIGADGQRVSGGITIATVSKLPADEHPTQWFDRLIGSIATADKPVSAASSASTKVVTDTSTGSPSATPAAASSASARSGASASHH